MPQDTNHIQQTIADLEAWRAQIDVAIQALRALDSKGPILPSSGPPRVGANGEVQSDSFFQMTVPDAAEKYLKIVKTTKEIPDIADALLRGGLKTSSKNFNDMTRSVVSRDERFVKVPSGGWGLAEWYPAMRKERKPKAAAEDESVPQPQENATGKETAGDRVLATILSNANTEWTASKIAEVSGLKINTVRGTVYTLRQAGKVKNNPKGKGYVAA
jgi:hypothetical protein